MTVSVNQALGGIAPFAVLLGQSGVASNVTGTTDEQVQFSCAVPSGLIGPNSRLIIEPTWRFTNNANNKIMSVKIGTTLGGATSIWSRTSTTQLCQTPLIVHQMRGDVASQVEPYSGLSTYAVNVGGNPSTRTIDYALGQNVYITGQLANSGDSLQLDAISIYVRGPNWQ